MNSKNLRSCKKCKYDQNYEAVFSSAGPIVAAVVERPSGRLLKDSVIFTAVLYGRIYR